MILVFHLFRFICFQMIAKLINIRSPIFLSSFGFSNKSFQIFFHLKFHFSFLFQVNVLFNRLEYRINLLLKKAFVRHNSILSLMFS
jgi:hypothetical protein